FAAFSRQSEDRPATWHCEYRMRAADGSVRWVASRAAVLRRGASQRAVVVAGIHRDMTDERSAVENRIAAVQTEAELQGLRNQLNPHFLLNALNSIAAMLGRRNDLAREMIVALGGFLRRILSGKGSRLMPLEDELELVRDYLRIEQIRFEERLRWSVECAPETARIPVPPMLVLTLVENALKHGISRLERGGHVEISAGLAAGRLEISVVNDGPLGSNSSGFGLENCRRRIELATGGRGELHLIEEPGPRVRAAVLLPVTP
ncbi:MAG: histidine kinase, partial [Terrimicrobiaceae bacterium]|nr:histidine kinase [Terrimicrobiaceae bacterium]